ncbi:MAG: LysE family translocator [Marinicaulis sp.]|nr:LysE family translocator [Marinicaulis sp.]
MDPSLYLAFVAASALLILTPGPMVAFVTATTLARGLGHGFVAVAGSTLASAIQLGVVALGLTAILNAASEAFAIIKWIGVAYLLFLGINALRSPADALAAGKPKATARRTFVEAFFVNLTNPKALLFHGAFLPLFISADAPAGPQLALLAVTFLVIAFVMDCGWALFAARLQPVLAHTGRWRRRLTGGVLLTAAAGLALVRK